MVVLVVVVGPWMVAVVVVVLDSYLQIVAFVDMHNQPQFVVVAVVVGRILLLVVAVADVE